MKRFLLLTSILAGGAALAPSAHASLIFNLTQDNVGGIGPYVQVTVNRTAASTATVTFDALPLAGPTYYLMDGGSVALNVHGAFALGSLSGTAASGATQATYANGGAGNEDGFGSFNFTANSSDGWASRSSEIVVHLTGGNWTSDSDVLTLNSHGALAAAHIGFNGGATTGFAAGSGTSTPPTNTPEPASLALLGAGLLGLGMTRARRA